MSEFYAKDGIRKCVICGKEFYVPELTAWTYRKKTQSNRDYRAKWFCSWSCMRVFEQMLEDKKAKKRGDNEK